MSDAGKTINLKPFHCEMKAVDGGFDFIWLARSDGDKRYRIVLHCSMWWVRYIARDLWKMLAEKKSQIAEAESALTNGATP